jgi:putative transposase
LIYPDLKYQLIEHIKANSKVKGIWLDSINCTEDHIHIIISLRSESSISKEVVLIKGESSHWINQNKFCNGNFQWQDEYIAISVSESILDKVRTYINNQEEHHKRKTFTDEYNVFMAKFGNLHCEN